MPELTTSAPASLPRADSTRLTGVQVAERLNVPASTWRSYVAPGQAPQRTDASTPARRGGTAAHPGQDHRSSSCPVFAGSAQNPVDVIRELRCIQRRLSPAEVEALIAGYEGGGRVGGWRGSTASIARQSRHT
jgi:hypothetical protein